MFFLFFTKLMHLTYRYPIVINDGCFYMNIGQTTYRVELVTTKKAFFAINSNGQQHKLYICTLLYLSLLNMERLLLNFVNDFQLFRRYFNS